MCSKCSKVNSTTGPLTYSTYHSLTYGTPQGSCLGPLLFPVFINDLHHSVVHGISLVFADDTTLLHSHKNLRYLKWTVEDDLNRLMDWFKANKLTLNLDKTVRVLLSSQPKTQELTLEIGTNKLQSSDIVKFLGVWIDKKVTWNKHISTLIAKLKQNFHFLKMSNKFLTKATKKLIYYAHIYNNITYGILLWGNMISQSTLKKIQKIMNTCFSLITGLIPTPENFKKEKMMRLSDLIRKTKN